jgi:hypothetical protein
LCTLSRIDYDNYHIGLSHFSLDFNHCWGYKPNSWYEIPNGNWGTFILQEKVMRKLIRYRQLTLLIWALGFGLMVFALGGLVRSVAASEVIRWRSSRPTKLKELSAIGNWINAAKRRRAQPPMSTERVQALEK